jgi:hypothetical protein
MIWGLGMKGPKGEIYRYFSDRAGGAHFSGIMQESQVPNRCFEAIGTIGCVNW